MLARKKKSGLMSKISELFFSSYIFPLVLAFAMLGILFVLFRMKGVEMDYQRAALNKKVEKAILEKKELKAKKAKLLSVGHLRKLASKYGFKQPKKEQIIIVP